MATHSQRLTPHIIFFLRKMGFGPKKTIIKLKRMRLIENLWSLRAHMTHACCRWYSITLQWMMHSVPCIWPFSFFSTSWQNKNRLFISKWNERKTREKRERNYNLLLAQIFPLPRSWLMPYSFYLIFIVEWCDVVRYECIECIFFQFFGITRKC